jgi:hypothetical protein
MTRRFALFVCVATVFANPEDAPRPLTNDDVVNLIRAGFAEPVVVQAVQTNPSRFDLSGEALASLRAAGVGEAVIAAMSGDRSQPEPLRLLEPGVYVKRSDAYAIVEAEPIVWKTQASAPAGDFTRLILAGNLDHRNSRMALRLPAELLIVAPPGVSSAGWQLLRADEKQDSREFRAEAALRGGVLLGLSGRTTVPATLDKTFDLGVRVLLGSVRKGEYGLIPPGSVQSGAAAQGRIYTFSIE